jgi:type IV pilus assembly protein PilE
MFQRTAPRPSRATGFSLIELMITVLIISVLVAIAIPSYIDKVRKSRRTEAKTALLDLAGREERFYNTNNQYSVLPSDLGYGAIATAFPMTVGSGYYSVSVTTTAYAAGPPVTPAGYTITAVPVAGSDQAKDTHCQLFTLTSTGVQTSGPDTTTCWQ